MVSGAVSASGWLRGKEAADGGDCATSAQSSATGERRGDRALCCHHARKCQYRNLQLRSR